MFQEQEKLLWCATPEAEPERVWFIRMAPPMSNVTIDDPNAAGVKVTPGPTEAAFIRRENKEVMQVPVSQLRRPD